MRRFLDLFTDQYTSARIAERDAARATLNRLRGVLNAGPTGDGLETAVAIVRQRDEFRDHILYLEAAPIAELRELREAVARIEKYREEREQLFFGLAAALEKVTHERDELERQITNVEAQRDEARKRLAEAVERVKAVAPEMETERSERRLIRALGEE